MISFMSRAKLILIFSLVLGFFSVFAKPVYAIYPVTGSKKYFPFKFLLTCFLLLIGFSMATPVYGANTSLFSVSAWVKPSSSIASKAIMGKAEEMRLATDADGKPLCQIKSSSSWQTAVSSQTAITTGTWSHIVCTYDLVTFKIYINGELKGMQALTAVADDTAAVWKIGKDDSASTPYGFYQGLVDEYKFFNYALTSDEVKMDYDRGMSAQMGSVGGTSGTGAASNSAGAEYCVPGDTTSCAGPIAEWKMDEKTGTTAYDTSGNGKDGSLGTGSSAPTWTNGKYGSGLNFDGVNDKITIPEITTTDISVSAWVYPTNCGSGRWCAIVNSSTGITRYPAIRDGKFFVYDGNSNFGSINVPNNAWTHVALTFVGSTKALKTYVNGVLDLNRTGTQYSNAVINKIGIFDASDFPFSGKMDQIRVYNYVRTPVQIAWEYNKGKPIAEWRMNECQGGTIHDESGYGNNGTISLGSSGSQTTTLGNGTCITAGSTPWYNGRSGKYGASLNFDGTDDRVEQYSLNLMNEYSLSMWIKTSDGTENQLMFGALGEVGIFEWEIDGMGSNNGMKFRTHGDWTTETSGVSDDSWHHVIYVINGSNITAYIDGIQNVSDNLSYPGDFNTVLLGGYSNHFSGQIDEVKIFNYALTAEQIKTLYNASSAVNFGN